jgi:mycothiol system anti-sigma-R factor
VNEDGKHQDMQNKHERELTDLLNLLEAIDQRITPEHLTKRFRELTDSAGDGDAIPDSAGSPEPDAPEVSDQPARQETIPCCEFDDAVMRNTSDFDPVGFVNPPERWQLSADIVRAARSEAAVTIATAQRTAEKLIAEAEHAKVRAREAYEQAGRLRIQAQQDADDALNRAASMITDARRRAEDILAAAHADPDDIVGNARRQAEDILAAARTDANHTRDAQRQGWSFARECTLASASMIVLVAGEAAADKSALAALWRDHTPLNGTQPIEYAEPVSHVNADPGHNTVPHALGCSDVLDRVYSYLDGQLGENGRAEIRQHLDECGPCLREYGLEEAVKRLVHKHCGHNAVPEDLRIKVLTRVQRIAAEPRQPEPTTGKG